MLGDLPAFEHVDHESLDGCDRAAPGGRDASRAQRRPVTGTRQRAHFGLRGLEELEPVHHDVVTRTQVSKLARVLRAAAYLGHRRSLEVFLQKRRDVSASRIANSPQRKLLASTAGRQ